MTITPTLSLMYCPICGEKLLLEPIFSEKDSVCISCDYKEPEGLAHFVTFMTHVLSEFIGNLDFRKLAIGDLLTDDFQGVMASNAILPSILVNAKLSTKNIGSDVTLP